MYGISYEMLIINFYIIYIYNRDISENKIEIIPPAIKNLSNLIGL